MTTRWYINVLGGWKRRGQWPVDADATGITLLGGFDLDLTEAQVPAPQVTLTKISIAGGVSLLVPHDIDVVPEGFALVGAHDIEPARRDGPARCVVRVRNYGLFGGVEVRRVNQAPA
jgi:predicted membrane protein